jgi:hypothetical protein
MKAITSKLKSDHDVEIFVFNDNLYLIGNTRALSQSSYHQVREQKHALTKQLRNCPLSFEMNFCQRSMALDEILRPNRASNSIFVPINPTLDISEDAIRSTASAIHHRYPLLTSRVQIDDDRFTFHLDRNVSCLSFRLDNRRYLTQQEFVNAYESYAHILFESALCFIVGAKVGGRRQWGLWLHHIVADAPFIAHLLAIVRQSIEQSRQLSVTPDFDFLQQNWYIEQRHKESRHDSIVFWRRVADRYRGNVLASSELPLTEGVTTHTWHVDSEVGAAIKSKVNGGRLSLLSIFCAALAFGLTQYFPGSKVLALTTFTLRVPLNAEVCSGFYTTLLPFVLKHSEPVLIGNQETIVELNNRLRDTFDHGVLPLEEVLDLINVEAMALISIVNMVHFDDSSPIADDFFVLENRVSVRKPLVLTVAETRGTPTEITVAGCLPHAWVKSVLSALEAYVLNLISFSERC